MRIKSGFTLIEVLLYAAIFLLVIGTIINTAFNLTTQSQQTVAQEYLVDEFVEAQVYQDGEIQITQRPTLTRMAAGAILPGSALIPGLAFQKKKKNDLPTMSC